MGRRLQQHEAAVVGGAASLWGSYSYSLVLAPFPRPYSVDSHTLPGTQWNLQCECAQWAQQVRLPHCNFGMSHEDSGGTQQ